MKNYVSISLSGDVINGVNFNLPVSSPTLFSLFLPIKICIILWPKMNFLFLNFGFLYIFKNRHVHFSILTQWLIQNYYYFLLKLVQNKIYSRLCKYNVGIYLLLSGSNVKQSPRRRRFKTEKKKRYLVSLGTSGSSAATFFRGPPKIFHGD